MTKQTMMVRLAVLFLGGALAAVAQQQQQPPVDLMAPVGPAHSPQEQQAEPPAPMAQLTADNPFPAENPQMFTAALPTKATVNSFLQALWGYDPARTWDVAGIEKTEAEGVSKVTVLMANRGGGGLQRAVFFVLPDQKHAISNTVIPFGVHPFAEARKVLEDRADGPAKGAAGKDLLLVEFADLQCPHCKDAQTIMSQLAVDFPQARIVFEDVPVSGHPAAFQAASYGVCVAQQGDAKFFSYAQSIYDNQAALTPAGTEQALKDAVGKTGLDPETVAACAATQATKDVVARAVKLGQDLDVERTPLLYVNGRMVAIEGASYDAVKNIVVHEAQMDGVSVAAPVPRLTTLQ